MTKAILLSLFGLLIAGCTTSTPSDKVARSTDPAAILERIWQWEATTTSTETIAVSEPERYTLQLGQDGRAQIRFDCNVGGGDYRIGVGTLSFGPMLSTRMACPPDSLDALFMRDIEAAVTFYVEEGNLYLGLKDKGGTMKFGLVPSPPTSAR